MDVVLAAPMHTFTIFVIIFMFFVLFVMSFYHKPKDSWFHFVQY